MILSNVMAQLKKKTVINCLVAFLIVDVLVLSYYQVTSPIQEEIEDLSPYSLFLSPTEFQKRAMALLSQVKNDKVRFWSAYSELSHLDVEIPLSKILPEDESKSPSELFYDPRLTIAVYIDELRRGGETDILPTLPFHWVDWVNVTIFNDEIGVEENKKLTCQRLRSRISGRPRMEQFCKNREDVTAEDMEMLGFKDKQRLPNAVIFDHCPHTNTAYNDARKLMAKSYTMTHMTKPYKVIILGDNESGGTYEFMVNQARQSDQQILFSGMTERFVSSAMGASSKELRQKGQNLKFNSKNIYNDLRRSVQSRKPDQSESTMRMYRAIKSDMENSKSLSLEEKDFDYPRERIQTQIEEYESKSETSVFDSNYLDGLKECAKYDGTNEPTYFKMALLNAHEYKNGDNDWGWHYDWRFFDDALFYRKPGWTRTERLERTNIILERLLRTWNRFAEEKGIISWIMHGPLLSWYWDGLMFPFDVDIDIQMPISELVRLSKQFNQTLVVESPTEGFGKFLIDVGTYIHNRERSDTSNHIDARFIDVDSGLYIDITGLAKSTFDLPAEYKKKPIVEKNEGDANTEVYNDRRKHFYTLPQLSPLRYSMLGSIPVFVPHVIEDRLRWEYERGLDDYNFHDWFFVPLLQLWIPKAKLRKLFNEDDFRNERSQFDAQKMVARVLIMSDDEGLKLLEDDEVLTEYYLTSQYTDWHTHEKSVLFGADGKDNTTSLEDSNVRKDYNGLLEKVKFHKPLHKCLFEYEAFDRTEHISLPTSQTPQRPPPPRFPQRLRQMPEIFE